MNRAKWMMVCGGLAVLTFICGNVTGFFAGVYSTRLGSEFINGMFEQEQPADVARPAVIERRAFTLKYPGNWTIDSTDDDYEPDHAFNIESPGSSFISFHVFDAELDPATNVETQVTTFTSASLKDATRTEFKTWGSFRGSGTVLRGRILGFLPGYIRIFSATVDSRSFVVVEETYDEDAQMVEPGFRLIESSFAFRSVVAENPSQR